MILLPDRDVVSIQMFGDLFKSSLCVCVCYTLPGFVVGEA